MKSNSAKKKQVYQPSAPGEVTSISRGAYLPMKIFNPPGDTRQLVNPTTALPYNCIGQITSHFPNGVYTGTGTLIDEYHVLTCAHNIFNNLTGKLIKNATFACARNGGNYPYGAPIEAADVFITDDYRETSPPNPNDPNFNPGEITPYLADYGLIRLKTPVPNQVVNFPRMYAATDQELTAQMRIAGYPGDKPDTMWEATGAVTTPPAPFLFYRIATLNGQSGASVLGRFQHPVGNFWYGIVGIHVAGSTQPAINTNFAVRVTQEVMDTVNSWM